jgi:2-succinyl-5-enolpyruvyl-6-hydroxy-3-cyclohexene-1-carboxylate synthase
MLGWPSRSEMVCPDPSDGAVQVTAARLLLEGAVASGVRDLVVSPGSRSTPLVLAALGIPELRLHDIVDERSAGFFALGLARATGLPSALLCTSGSAGAHYFPAVLEAEAAHLPLLVLTADRPHERQDCAAPQTADQIGLFGRHVRAFYDLPAAEPRPRVLRAARRIGAQAAARTRFPTPGAVHVNVHARKPLEPAEGDPRDGGLDVGTGGVAVQFPTSTPSDAALAELASRCRSAERPLVVCGPAPFWRAAETEAVLALLRVLGFPVFAEVTSQLRYAGTSRRAGIPWCDELAVVLDSAVARRRLDPDLVLQLGTPPISAGYEDLLESPSVREHVVIAEHGFPDPVSTATLVVQAPLAACAKALRAELGIAPLPGSGGAWHQRLRGACDAARAAIEAVACRDGEGIVARVVAESLPENALLALGNSLPVRSMEVFAPELQCSLRVWSQRGLAGIDGLVSGVAGSLVALARSPSPPPAAALLLGDLSFLHDLGGLATLRHVELPLAVIVLQNGGGRIFEQLPLASSSAGARSLPHFVMPQDLDVAGACAAFGLPFARVAGRAELAEALHTALGRRVASVLEVIVPEHAAVAERATLRQAMAGVRP